MEKITNYLQLNEFIKKNITSQKYKDNRNLTIDYCNISEKLLLKYISKAYSNNDENAMFNCYTIYSYFSNNLMEIKKNIANIEQTSKLEVIIVLVNLSDEAFDNLSAQNKFYYLHLINIKDYKPEIIPSWKEQILSILILSSFDDKPSTFETASVNSVLEFCNLVIVVMLVLSFFDSVGRTSSFNFSFGKSCDVEVLSFSIGIDFKTFV